jgi:autotransporter-associated beta strand protein
LGGGNATDNNLALVKAGIGELTLTRANTYSGGTTISNGFLNVGNTSGSGTGSGFVSVKSGGSLSGTGIITGAVIVNNGGALSPGDMGIGQLRISNALTLAAGSTTAMEINKSTSTSDAVVGLTSVSYNGTLTVTNLGGTLAAGDSFKLFNATSYNGSFDAIVPAAPGAWLAWDTNTLAIDGTLRVLAVCEVTFVSQPVGRAAVVGGTVSFSATAHTTTGVTNYQWQFAGLPIPGATNKLLVVNSVQATNFGAYAVVVGNGLCSSPSKTVQLTQAVRPSFLPSRLNGTTISMSFPTELGPVYVVEYNGTVDDATWQVLNTLNGTGNNELVTDTIANALTRFYRIRMQ